MLAIAFRPSSVRAGTRRLAPALFLAALGAASASAAPLPQRAPDSPAAIEARPGDPFLLFLGQRDGPRGIVGNGLFPSDGATRIEVRLPARAEPLLCTSSLVLLEGSRRWVLAGPGDLSPEWLQLDGPEGRLLTVEVEAVGASAPAEGTQSYRAQAVNRGKLFGAWSFFPNVVGAGDEIRIQGAGFGRDTANLCSLVFDSAGRVVGMSRALATDGRELVTSVGAVEPGATSGRIGIARGEGSTVPPTGLPADTIVLDSWVWRANGGPELMMGSEITLDSPSARAGCTTLYGTVQPSGNLEVTIPTGSTCPPGSTLRFQMDVSSSLGTLRFDTAISLQNTVAWDAATCASRVCAAFQLALFQRYGIFTSCSTQIDAMGNVKLVLSPPPGEQFLYGSVYLTLCS